jgi:hypothetical protein
LTQRTLLPKNRAHLSISYWDSIVEPVYPVEYNGLPSQYISTAESYLYLSECPNVTNCPTVLLFSIHSLYLHNSTIATFNLKEQTNSSCLNHPILLTLDNTRPGLTRLIRNITPRNTRDPLPHLPTNTHWQKPFRQLYSSKLLL